MYISIRSVFNIVLCFCITSLLGACSSVLRHPLPADHYLEATVLGRDDLRYWGDEALPLDKRLEEHQKYGDELGWNVSGLANREHHYLAILPVTLQPHL